MRFWSMFRFPFDTHDIGGQLRRRTEAKGQRSIRIDLNMKGPIPGESRGVESTSNRHFKTGNELRRRKIGAMLDCQFK